MTNRIYPIGKDYIIANGGLITGNVKAMLVSTDPTKGNGRYYTVADTDQFLSIVPAGARRSAGVALTNKTTQNGVYNADPVTFPAVAGDTVQAMILYIDTGTEANSPLIGYFDVLAGFPFLPSGADVQAVWDGGVYKIFAI